MSKGCRHIKIGDATAILCGGEPTDHECNDKGPVMYTFSDGDSCSLFDKARKERMNLNMCDADKLHFIREKGIDIRGGSVSCSICKRLASADMYYL
jgi:hypothetical protein